MENGKTGWQGVLSPVKYTEGNSPFFEVVQYGKMFVELLSTYNDIQAM